MKEELIINEILESKEEIKKELELISLMNMDIGTDVKLVKLRSHIRELLKKAIQLKEKR